MFVDCPQVEHESLESLCWSVDFLFCAISCNMMISNSDGFGCIESWRLKITLLAPSRYFIVKSSNRENLELSVERGLWATHRNNEAKLNEAFDTCDHVILVFSVNETRHFQVNTHFASPHHSVWWLFDP